MKLLSVKFSNLNSLRGENAIDFMNPPISDTGLFAITGDTGSGKTTILDAITLGLYGRIHRNKNQGDVMSYGTGSCYAEVEFAVKNEIYRSKWSLRKARGKADGNLQTPVRELSKRDKSGGFGIIAEKVASVNKEIEQITGLDFDRFTRSVILAQGDFAAFLRAKDEERGELLERITGTEIYSRLSIAAHERERDEKNKLENLRARQEGMQLLDEEEVAALKEEREKLTAAIVTLEKELNELIEQIQRAEQYEELSTKKKTLSLHEKQLQDDLRNFRPDIQRLHSHKKAMPLQAELARIDDLKIQIDSLKTKNTELARRITNTDKNAGHLRETLAETTKKLADVRAENTKKSEVFDQVIKLDVTIEEQSKKTFQLEKDLKDIREKLKTNASRIDKLSAQKQSFEAENQNIQKWLTAHAQYQKLTGEMSGIEAYRKTLGENFIEQKSLKSRIASLEKERHDLLRAKKTLESGYKQHEKEIQEFKTSFEKISRGEKYENHTAVTAQISRRLEGLTEEKRKLERIRSLHQQFVELAKELNVFETQKREAEEARKTLEKTIRNTEKSHKKLQSTLDYKRHTWENVLKVEKYEAERHELKEGEPCPVCFSTEHPFRKKDLKPFDDIAKREFRQAEKKFNESEKKLQQLKQEYDRLTHKIELLTGDGHPASGQIPSFEAKISALQQKLRQEDVESYRKFPIEESKLSSHIIAIDAEREKLNNQRDSLTSLIDNLTKKEKKFNDLRAELQAKEGDWQRKTDEINRAHMEMETLKAKFETTEKELNRILKPYGYRFDVTDGKAMFNELRNMAAQYNEKSKRAADLDKEISLLEQAIKQDGDNKQSLEESLNQISLSLEKQSDKLSGLKQKRTDLFGDADPIKEKKRLAEAIREAEKSKESRKQELDEVLVEQKTLRASLQNNRKALDENEKKSATLTKSLYEKAQKNGFDSLDALRNAILTAPEAKKIETRQSSLENEILKVKTQLKSTGSALRKLVNAGVEMAVLRELREKKDKKQAVVAGMQQSMGAIAQRIRDDARLKKEAASLIKKIEKQRKTHHIWAVLKSMIGSNDGKKFRVFAQGLTLRKLVSLANRHLQNLNPRYLIHKPNEANLRLMIVDTFQAGNTRSMETLSGGESFLVSLALAMGLSNMAGGNTEIGSLFIDEGFGSLDEATLEMAIATLENLQSSGKTIGIVSHVKELKERISTQIRVKKTGGGVSVLEIQG